MTPARTFRFLRPEDIRRLESFEFAPQAVVDGYLAGRHRAKTRGSSTEFHDYRAYVPGDDPALIDWRAYARTDRYYLRTYEQETDLECHLLVDSSGSMDFGEKLTKLEYASFLAAALAYLVVRAGDRVSLTLFDDGPRQVLPPGSTARHLHHVLHALEGNRPGGRTSTAAALRRVFPTLRRRGTVVVLADFLDEPAEIFAALNPYLHARFRVHLFQILDPAETDLGERGLRAFVDLETRERLVVHTDVLRPAYARALAAHQAALRDLAMRRRVDFATVRTDQPFHLLFDRLNR